MLWLAAVGGVMSRDFVKRMKVHSHHSLQYQGQDKTRKAAYAYVDIPVDTPVDVPVELHVQHAAHF